MSGLQILPVCVGVAPGVDRSTFLWGLGAGVLLDSPSIIWVITGGDSPVVVDTGSGTPDWVSRHHRPFTRTPAQEPGAALAAAGVDPASVRLVVLSHLHYDHCHNNDLFPNARFVVQREEVRYAVAPHPVHAEVYEAPARGFTPPWLATMDRTDVIEGDALLAAGVRVTPVPGHSPGMMATIVETAAGPYAVASDFCSLYENWRGFGPHRRIPSRVYVNLDDYYRSFAKLAAITDDVLPGHDIRVLEQAVYP